MSDDLKQAEEYLAQSGIAKRRSITPRDLYAALASGDPQYVEILRKLERELEFERPRFEQHGSWSNIGIRVYPGELEEKFSDLQKQVDDLKFRVDRFEQINSSVFIEDNWFDIVGTMLGLFSSLDSLMQVYCEKNDRGCDLLFIHNSNDRIREEEEIISKTLELEEKYPMLMFDYLILHTEEAAQADLASKILIFDNTQST